MEMQISWYRHQAQSPFSSVTFHNVIFLSFNVTLYTLITFWLGYNLYLKLLQRSKIKIFLKIIKIITFLLMTYIQKMSYLEVSPPGHTIVYKNINDV